MNWRFHHKEETVSTNLDAREGQHGDVYLATRQTAGRGRLDHKWISAADSNLLMSVVLDVSGMSPEAVATFPLMIGLSVAKAVNGVIKWPNDILVGGRKVAGILCERNGDLVIAGIGVNLGEQQFPAEIAASAGFIPKMSVPRMREMVLGEIAWWHGTWKNCGFSAIYPEIVRRDILRGRTLTVRQTDGDQKPVKGFCKGIAEDGSLVVGDQRLYAGEAHIGAIR